MMGPEATIEKNLAEYAQDLGIYTRKFVSPGQVAVPDRVFLLGIHALFIEVKRKGKKPTEAQQDEIREIRDRGGLATWTSSTLHGRHLLRVFRAQDFKLLDALCRSKNYWEE